MKKSRFSIAFVLTLCLILSNTTVQAQDVFYVEASTTYVLPNYFSPIPVGGDTIKIVAGRTETLKFKGFEGNENSPIVFINDGGQVHINTTAWGALSFENCKYIKLSGKGDPDVHYGFKLQGGTSGLSFLEYSSDCEVEFVEIEGLASTFFGIYAKKDFRGNPPIPYPVFNNLSIHDTYIHDLAEGMYIGETISPGMEFKHLRVYNNIVVNTLRESVQIANSIDDVEIYNNFFLNSGIEDMITQNNGLQIGTNTIANAYNNIIINSTGFGVIVLGNGDITLKNNFIQYSEGIFIDNRFAVLPISPIRIEENFLGEVDNVQVIENLNEFNDLFILNNFYSPNLLFFKNSVESLGILEVENNQLTTIDDFEYTLENGIFQNLNNNPLAYQTMGPQTGLGHVFNETPQLQTIEDILITDSESLTIQIYATVSDFDILHFEGRDLPTFLQLNEISSGEAELILNPLAEHVGVYEIGIMVYDESHQAYARQIIQVSVMNPDNHAPELSFDTELNIEAASKFQLDITASDVDMDEISYSITPLPSFVKIITNGAQTLLDLQPKPTDVGQYILEVTADDGYGSPAARTLTLNINAITLSNGRIIYRVNFGGPEIVADPLNWEEDLSSQSVYATTYFLRTGSWSWSGVNNTSAPNNLFGPYRYDAAGGTEMQFEFPLPTSGRYEVKLFFAERSTEVTANTTGTFHVFLENSEVLNTFNIYQSTTFDANEQSFEVLVEDGILNLNFQQLENNTKINGVEIIYLGEILENAAPEIQAISPIVLNENEVLEIPIIILDDNFENCNSISLSAIDFPSFLSIIQDEDGDYFLNLHPNFDDAGIYKNTVLFVTDGCLDSSTSLSITVNNTNRLPIFEKIETIELQAGDDLNIDVSASDADNDLLTFNMINAPDFIQLIDLGNNQAKLHLNPTLSNIGNFTFEIRATDNNFETSSLTIAIDISPAPISNRIILNGKMITDLVDRGSHHSPSNLVNEQNQDPFKNRHPKSKSWVPSKRISGSPFSTLIDLGEEYYIDFAMLHDMRYTDDLHISVGTPDNWTEIKNYTTSSYKKWKKVNMGAKSRYLLLTMYNTVKAQINELALYGYAVNPTKKSSITENTSSFPSFKIYPNPAQDYLKIHNKSTDQIIEILSTSGKVLLRTQEDKAEISHLPNGIYLLRLFDQEEMIFQDRFIKY